MITLCNNQECSRRHNCIRYLTYKEHELEARQGKHFVCLISICDAAKCSLYLERNNEYLVNANWDN